MIVIRVFTVSRSDMFGAIYNGSANRKSKTLRAHVKKKLHASSQGGVL